MKCIVQGIGNVSLTDRDFIAEGGEGKVYGQGKTVYKIYNEPSKALPEAKLRELSELTLPNILNPQRMILDSTGHAIGYTMDWVTGTVPMCKLFTNAFRDSVGVKPEDIVELVEGMVEGFHFIHAHQCLIVDANEMNFLVDEATFRIPYFIDVDSYQTKNFNATAIMPSIRDWHSPKFSVLTDWFSFAIVSCQLFVGIHPFKGKHPNYKKQDMERRMKDNVSIFNKDVSLPAAARDFSLIPNTFRNWYINLFEKGERSKPPTITGPIVVHASITTFKSTEKLEIERLFDFGEMVVWHDYVNGKRVVATDNHIWIDKNKHPISSPNMGVVITDKMQQAVFLKLEGDRLQTYSVDHKASVGGNDYAGYDMMIKENRIFLKHPVGMNELYIGTLSSDNVHVPYVSMHQTWNMVYNSAQFFNGVVYHQPLGKHCFNVPFTKGNVKCCAVQMIKELDGYRLIDARSQANVIIGIAEKDGKYHRFTFIFNDDFNKYECRIEADVDLVDIRMTVLPNGVVIEIPEDGKLLVYKAKIGNSQVMEVEDKSINTRMRLSHEGTTVVFTEGNCLYRMKLK